MEAAIEDLRLALNWAMAGDAKAAADFTQSAFVGFVKALKED